MSDDFDDLPGSAFPINKTGPRVKREPTTAARTLPGEVVFELLQRALNSPNGIAIEFESEGQAVNWHQRYNMMRASLIRRADSPQELRTIAVRRDGHRVLFEPIDNFIKRLKITPL